VTTHLAVASGSVSTIAETYDDALMAKLPHRFWVEVDAHRSYAVLPESPQQVFTAAPQTEDLHALPSLRPLLVLDSEFAVRSTTFEDAKPGADAEADEAFLGAILQQVFPLGPGLEDFLGLGERQFARLGQFQAAPDALEQRHAQPFFELGDLPGERLRRQMQALRRAGDSARAGDTDEVMQVLIVEHAALQLFVFFDHNAFLYVFVSNLVHAHNCCLVFRSIQRNAMNLKIQAQGLALTDGLRQHVAMRLAYALNYGRDIVTRIVVRLSDVNGPRGGEDKCCDIEVRLKGAPALIVEDIQSDLYVAIDRATGRVGHALDRHLARRRDFPLVSATRRQPFTDEAPCSTLPI
jgi:putative sigma-54 modulation protein